MPRVVGIRPPGGAPQRAATTLSETSGQAMGNASALRRRGCRAPSLLICLVGFDREDNERIDPSRIRDLEIGDTRRNHRPMALSRVE